MGARIVIRLVLASASDVADERLIAEKIIQEMNQSTAMRLGFVIELVRWEDVPPGFHEGGAQDLIDESFRIGESDLVVGLFWKRPGAGTLHEIGEARAARKASGRPRVLLYFRIEGKLPTHEELNHFSRLLDFKEQVKTEGLYKEYSDPPEFEKRFRQNLTDILFDLASPRSPVASDVGLIGTISTVPRLIRSEGITEPVGDIEIRLWPTRDRLKIDGDLTIFLNTNIANRIGGGNKLPEVNLVHVDQQREQTKAMMAATIVSASSVIFRAVALDFDAEESILLRVTGLRGNAFQLGARASTMTPIQIAAHVRIESDGLQQRILNPTVTVGLSEIGFAFGLKSSSDGTFSTVVISRETGLNSAESLNDPPDHHGLSFLLEFREGFPNAFRAQTEEAGDSGTRFLVRFSQVPEGVDLFVTRTNTLEGRVFDGAHNHESVRASLVNANTIGGSTVAPEAPVNANAEDASAPTTLLVRAKRVGQSAFAVWEAVSPGTFAGDRITFGVFIRCKPGASLGTCSINGSLAPLTNVGVASGNDPIPRFGDVSSPILAFSIIQ